MGDIEPTMADLCAACGGRPSGGKLGVMFAGASLDTRETGRGNVFFALKGTRTDGHRFVREAAGRGAAGAVVENAPSPRPPAGFPLIRVRSTARALADSAAWWRRRYRIPVVAITGSNGKTTSKDLAAHVLTGAFGAGVTATSGNRNNHLGVPLTLFRIGAGTRVAVLEMAMNHRGEIGRLASIAAPGVGVILNASLAHLGFLGSVEGVARAKAELIAALPSGGYAILNAGDPAVWEKRGLTRARVLGFGIGTGEVRAERVKLDGTGRPGFVLRTPSGSARVRLGFPGAHNAGNAVAAAAVGYVFGMEPAEIASRLSCFRPRARMRFENRRLPGGARALVDCYNANPASVSAALSHLEGIGAHRPVLVLGEMLELGPGSVKEHRRIGRAAARLCPSLLAGIGRGAREIVAEGRRAGVSRAAWHAKAADALDDVRSALKPGRVVLFKGSRKVGLEKLVDLLGGRGHRAV